jgi:hypothetical protein
MEAGGAKKALPVFYVIPLDWTLPWFCGILPGVPDRGK